MSDWKGRRILLAVSGGIAAYKACAIASSLGKAGAEVWPVLTDAAQRFVTPLSFSTLCRRPAATDADFWNASRGRPLHIELGEWAELILVAPLTANTLAQLAQGAADNLLTNCLLASTCPVLLAPAMNTDMWHQRSVQRNWQQVLEDPRFHGTEPGVGLLACDRQGSGRMAEPAQLLDQLTSLLHRSERHHPGQRDLQGKRILISAGSTQEFIDAVRFIGNPASGRMGIALALAAHHRGAQVTLVHGPMHPSDLAPLGSAALSAALPAALRAAIVAQPVTSAAEMEQALGQTFPSHDWLLMAAAVADFQPALKSADRHRQKLPKAAVPNPLPLAPVPDLVAGLCAQKQPHQKILGFAAQTGDILAPAQAKLQRKGLDAIVANPVDVVGAGFGGDRNQGLFLTPAGQQISLPPSSKLTMAHRIYDAMLEQFS